MDRALTDSNMRRSSLVERAFAAVVILFSTGAFANLWVTVERLADPRAGMALMELFWAATYVCSILMLWRHCRGSFQRLLKEKWILALVGLALCSAAWSEVPLVTMRHALGIAAGCLFSLYLVERFTFNEQLEILGWAFGLAAVLSFVVGTFNWGSAIIETPGWIGIYSQKNVLGRTMAVGALVFSLLSERSNVGRWLARAALILCLILLVLSQSMTSLVILLPVLYAKRWFRLTIQGKGSVRRRIWVTVLVGSLVLTLIVSNFGWISELLNRDPGLTGRTVLWAVLVPMALEKPWLGYGFGGFWLGEEGPSSEVWELHGFPTPNGHNGLLDLILDLGITGVTITILGYVSSLRRAVQVFAVERTWENAWPLLFLMALFLLNLTESVFFAANVFSWLIYVSVVLYVSRRAALLQTSPAPMVLAGAQA
jgi:exopolysaccharide production protein ExoQ